MLQIIREEGEVIGWGGNEWPIINQPFGGLIAFISSIQQTTARNSTSKPFFYKCVVNVFGGVAPQSFECMSTETSCLWSNRDG